MIDDAALAAFATSHAANRVALRELVDSLAATTGTTRFYVFWTGGDATAGGGGAADRPRTLLAFPTPDAALAFAQRNRLASAAVRPRLRALSLLQLFQAMLARPAIGALLLVNEGANEFLAAGRLPAGLRLERAELLRRLGLA